MMNYSSYRLWAAASVLFVVALDLLVFGSAESLILAATVVGDVTEDDTPDDHQVRDVSDVLTERMPSRFPIDTIMRTMDMEEPAEAEKVEWEEDDRIPRKSESNSDVTADTTVDVDVEDVEYFRIDDQVLLPDHDNDVVIVDDISGDTLTLRGLGGDNVPGINNGDELIRFGNAKKEFFEASDSRTTMPEQKYNYVHAFDAVIQISGRRRATRNYTRQDWERSRDRQLFDYRNNIENTLIVGKRSKQQVNGENLTTMAGILHYVDTNEITYTIGDVSESDLITWARTVFAGNSGADTRWLFADAKLTEELANVHLDKVRRTQVESQTLQMELERIETAFGNMNVVYHAGFDEIGLEDFGLILDMTQIRRRVLRPMQTVELNLEEQGKDGFGIQIKEESTVEVRYEVTHAILNGSP